MDLVFKDTLDKEAVHEVINKVLLHNQREIGTIDLSSITFVKPYGMVLFLQLLDHLESIRRIIYPTSNALTYMERANFFDNASKYIKLSTSVQNLRKSVARDSRNSTMIEITKIENNNDISATMERILNQTSSILETELNYDSNDITSFVTLLSELLSNIPRHSKAYGYICAQTYRYPRSSKRYVSVCVSDKGIGMRKSYEESDYLHITKCTNEKALTLAVLEGRSSKKRGGNGYKGIKEITEKFKGSLYVRSGDADIEIFHKKGEMMERRKHLSELFGTQVEIKLPQK